MLKYVKDCKMKYVRGSEVEYVKCVLLGICDCQRDEKVVIRATKALLELSKEQGRDRFISRKDIVSRAGFERYKGPGSAGLWPWLKKNADVVEKEEGRYRIRNEFYSAIEQVLSEDC